MPKAKTTKKRGRAQVRTRTQYEKCGGKPLKWMPSIKEVDKPLSKEDSVRYIEATGGEMTTTTKKKGKKQVTPTEDQGCRATRNRYKLAGEKPLHWIRDIAQSDKPLTKEGSVRYLGETQGDVSDEDDEEEVLEEATPRTTRRLYKQSGEKPLRWLKNMKEVKMPLSKEGSVRYIRENVDDDSDQGDDEEETTPITTRRKYQDSGEKPLQWIRNIKEVDRPLTSESSIRFQKETQEIDRESESEDEEVEESVGTRTTRKMYKGSGQKPLRWLRDIKEVEKPLTSENSVRYINELKRRNKLGTGGSNKTVTFEETDEETTQPENKKRKSSRTNTSNKKAKLDEVQDKSQSQDQLATRNQYKMSGAPSLEWIRDMNESARPLTRKGSVRFEKESAKTPVNSKQTINKAKKATTSKEIKKADSKTSSSDITQGARMTRNRRAMAGEKSLKWIKNISETAKPLSSEDSLRYKNEIEQSSVLPSLRAIKKTNTRKKTRRGVSKRGRRGKHARTVKKNIDKNKDEDSENESVEYQSDKDNEEIEDSDKDDVVEDSDKDVIEDSEKDDVMEDSDKEDVIEDSGKDDVMEDSDKEDVIEDIVEEEATNNLSSEENQLKNDLKDESGIEESDHEDENHDKLEKYEEEEGLKRQEENKVKKDNVDSTDEEDADFKDCEMGEENTSDIEDASNINLKSNDIVDKAITNKQESEAVEDRSNSVDIVSQSGKEDPKIIKEKTTPEYSGSDEDAESALRRSSTKSLDLNILQPANNGNNPDSPLPKSVSRRSTVKLNTTESVSASQSDNLSTIGQFDSTSFTRIFNKKLMADNPNTIVQVDSTSAPRTYGKKQSDKSFSLDNIELCDNDNLMSTSDLQQYKGDFTDKKSKDVKYLLLSNDDPYLDSSLPESKSNQF